MAMDQFIKLDGIEGEAQDKGHKEEVDVLAWSIGYSNSGTTHMGSGSGAGKVNVQDLSFTKYTDKATIPLMKHCFDGKHIKEATLVVRKAGGTPLEYVLIKMTDIIVTSVSQGGSGGEDRMTENVTLNFGAIDMTYVEQKPDGSAGEKPNFKYDIAKNAEA